MERQTTRHEALPDDVSERVVELLARPALVDLPDSPVGQLSERLKALFSAYEPVETSEFVDLESARKLLLHDPVYVPAERLFHVDATRILRYDLSLPLALSARGRGAPLRLLSAGKVYRDEIESATHLAAFHQLELLALDDAANNDPWAFVGRVLQVLDQLLPGLPQRVERTDYPFCERAWDIGVELDGEYSELLGCGVYKADVVRLLGGDPERHVALGLGLGLERLASLHFQVPDIRKLGAES
jgi:phenylalanyl-tRNA synthetase alpha chain